jgi:hypothetical protein
MMDDMKTRAGRKVAVLGPIPRDQIVTHAGERFEKYGCVLYTAVALSALLDAGDVVFPVSHVRRRDEGPIKEILGSFPNIDTSGITSLADQGDVIELRYIEHNRRVERQASFMNPILPARSSVSRSRTTRWDSRRCGTSRSTAGPSWCWMPTARR